MEKKKFILKWVDGPSDTTAPRVHKVVYYHNICCQLCNRWCRSAPSRKGRFQIYVVKLSGRTLLLQEENNSIHKKTDKKNKHTQFVRLSFLNLLMLVLKFIACRNISQELHCLRPSVIIISFLPFSN